MRLHLLPILLCLALSATLFAIPVFAEPDVQLAEPHIDTIEDIAWLVGNWQGEHFGDLATTSLSMPTGNVIAGSYRVVNAEGICTIIELDCIEASDTGLTWHYNIFGPGMEPLDSPFGQAGAWKMQCLSDTKLRYWDESGKTALKGGSMELLADGRMKSTVTLVGEKGEQTIEFFSSRVE